MAQWPPTPVSEIPDSGSSWPSRVEVGPVTLIGPTAENQQPTALDTRTESIRDLVNTLVSILNVVREHFLDIDGDDPAIEGSTQGPVFMRGDFDVGGFNIVNLADGTALTDAITDQQLEAVQFSAEDDVEQVLDTRTVFVNGSAAMIANLDVSNNRVLTVDTALIGTDANRKSYVDAEITTLETSLLKRTGIPSMLADLSFDGVLPTDPGFIPFNLGDPTSSADLVNKRYLDEQAAITGAEDVPIAAVLPFGGPASQIPANFLLCDGREVSRFTFQNLFNIIGIAYGSPSSGSVFKLPDLRGRVVTGLDNMSGQSADRITQSFADSLGGKGGEERHAITVGEMAIHDHDYDDISYAGGGAGSEQGDTGASDADNLKASTVRSSQLEGAGTSHLNMQPSMAFNWIIRM